MTSQVYMTTLDQRRAQLNDISILDKSCVTANSNSLVTSGLNSRWTASLSHVHAGYIYVSEAKRWIQILRREKKISKWRRSFLFSSQLLWISSIQSSAEVSNARWSVEKGWVRISQRFWDQVNKEKMSWGKKRTCICFRKRRNNKLLILMIEEIG